MRGAALNGHAAAIRALKEVGALLAH